MIKSQLEIIAQGKAYVSALTDEHYSTVKIPQFNSSAGTHMRHILDHYLALIHREGNCVNYNVRHRFSDVETSVSAALVQLAEVETWLHQLEPGMLNMPVEIISEISVSEQQNYACHSTLGRELVFVSSHAVHHYFTLKQIAKALEIQADDDLGIAPATATFQRAQIAS